MLSMRTLAPRARFVSRLAVATVVAGSALWASACSDSTTPIAPGFLGGTATNHEIGLIVNSTGKAVTLFQLGSPTTREEIPFGSSSDITPVGFSIRGRYAVVPLGNTASVAYVGLETATVQRHFLFSGGNATGSVFVNDTTALVTNTNTNLLGKFTVGQASDSIRDTVTVAKSPTAIVMAGNRAFVISGNLVNYAPVGNSIVTAVDPVTMHVIDTVSTGGTNAQDAALGPDGLLYVVNTADYVAQGSLTIINPNTMTVVTTVPNMGVGAGAITIDANGLAYVSSYYGGTVVWNTQTRQFVRDAAHPVCAPLTLGCRGAASAAVSANGTLYQTFAGDGINPPAVFVYAAGTFALTDSLPAGVGPAAIAIRRF